MRYFRKEIPRTPIYLPNGDKLVFESLDGVFGYHKTDRPDEIQALETLIAQHRGGVYPITQEEYDRDFGKKKQGSTPSVPASQWREEWGGGFAQDTQSPRISTPVAPAAAVPAPANPAPVPPAPTPEPPPAPKRTVRPPNVGRRQF
jgi:hypothetical protein